MIEVEFITHIKLSNTRRAKYYKKGSLIPKKYKGFLFNKKSQLIDNEGVAIVKNKLSIGKPKFWRITFQDFYSGNVHHSTRVKMKNQIIPYLILEFTKHEKVSKFPIRVVLTFLTNNNSDLDNESLIWVKLILDALKLTLIPEDDKKYVTELLIIHEENEANKIRIELQPVH